MTSQCSGFGLLLILCCSGCLVGTSKPIYDSAHDTVYDSRLVGRWGDSDEEIRIAQAPDRGYALTEVFKARAGQQTDAVRAELVSIGKYRYLFFKMPDYPGTLLWPCYRVSFCPRGLRLQAINVAMIEDILEKHPGTLRYEKPAEPAPATQPVVVHPGTSNFIITDEPAKVRAFIEIHQDDPGFVDDGQTLADLNPIT